MTVGKDNFHQPLLNDPVTLPANTTNYYSDKLLAKYMPQICSVYAIGKVMPLKMVDNNTELLIIRSFFQPSAPPLNGRPAREASVARDLASSYGQITQKDLVVEHTKRLFE